MIDFDGENSSFSLAHSSSLPLLPLVRLSSRLFIIGSLLFNHRFSSLSSLVLPYSSPVSLLVYHRFPFFSQLFVDDSLLLSLYHWFSSLLTYLSVPSIIIYLLLVPFICHLFINTFFSSHLIIIGSLLFSILYHWFSSFLL